MTMKSDHDHGNHDKPKGDDHDRVDGLNGGAEVMTTNVMIIP